MSDSDYDMSRGIAQILSSYGPWNVFDFGQLGVTVRVRPWDGTEFSDVDRERVARIVSSRADRHRNRTTEQEWSDLDADDIDIYQVRDVETELYPQVFYCEDCFKVESATQVEYLPASGACQNCGGELNQLSFVNVCPCGTLRDPGPEPCSDHDYQYIELVKVGEEPFTWRYRCEYEGCGNSLGGLHTPCDTCDEMRGPLPMGSSPIYYAQKAVEVDVPTLGVEDDDIPPGEPWARTNLAAHLGRLPLDENTIEGIAVQEGNVEQYQESVEKYGEETVDDILSDFGIDPYGHRVAIDMTEGVDPPEVRARTDEATQRLAYSNIAQQLFTFVRSTQGYEGDQEAVVDSRHPIPTSLTDQLSEPGFQERHPQSQLYRDQLTRSHIREAWVVDKFPLLNILYGYTRGKPRATETDLNSLPHPRHRGTIPVFADRTPSEAIIFEIDRRAVINWLEMTNTFEHINVEPPPADANELRLKEWFVENVATTDLENPFSDIRRPVTRRVYTLLHTFSHCLMSRAGEQAGLATGSLGERVLPVVPAIVIYAASTQNFALGSMFTLFKTRLHPWVGDAREQAEQCLLDPACREDAGGAACDACVHVAETSCELFNHRLDRRTLFDPDGVGFWDSTVENGIDYEPDSRSSPTGGTSH